MAITASDDQITSGNTDHVAVRTEGVDGWVVSWLPERVLDWNEAITAMVLAEFVEERRNPEAAETAEFRLAEFTRRVTGWAAEIGLTEDDAISRIMNRRAVGR